MNYNSLFKIAILLISSPAKAWEEIRMNKDRHRVLETFVYPMIGICALSVFIGSLFSKGWSEPEAFQYAMTKCCAEAVALFGGFFLAAYLINEIQVRWYGMPEGIRRTHVFAGYSLVVIFVLNIINGVFDDLGIISLLLQFYTVYIVWEGSGVIMQIREKKRTSFTILSSILLIACPTIIYVIFNKLTTLLN